MIERCHRRIYCLVVLGGIWMLLGGSTQTAEAKPQRKGPEVTIARSIQPVNVNGGVFFNQSCARAHAIYTVPAGKLLIIEDASALAVDSATASDPADPGIVDGVP